MGRLIDRGRRKGVKGQVVGVYSYPGFMARRVEGVTIAMQVHSSLVDYLAQVIYAKNCPTTSYCIFQLVWVPMTTTQNIRVCFLSSRKHFFS